MTKTTRTILLTFILTLWSTTTPVTFGQDAETLSSIDRIVSQIEAMYPRVEGLVVSLEGGDVLLDLKEGDPIQPGDKLKLFRYGEEVLHPVTQKKLGRKETELGEIEVVQIGSTFTRAKVTDKSVKARVGDGVRPAFRKISFLIAPPEAKTEKNIDGNRLTLALEKRLKSHPRFDVLPFDLGVWMLESGINADQLLKQKNLDRLREKVKADLILIPSVRSVKEKIVLRYEVVSADDGKVKNKAEVLSDPMPALEKTTSAKTGKEQAVSTDFGSRKGVLEFVTKQEFPFEIVDFDIGDLDGDGVNEYVIIDRNRVMVYKFDDNKFKPTAQTTFNKNNHRFLAVDVGDINGNGLDEIFVTSQYGGDSLNSFALEANSKQKRFDKIWDNVRLYLRIIRPFGAKPKLLAQQSGFQDPFAGGIKTIQYQGNGFGEGPEITVPSVYDTKFILYGLTQATLFSTKTNETIILDKDYHLRVYSPSGRLLVNSDEYYGHDPRIIDTGVKSDIIGMRQGEPVNFRGRLQLVQHGGKKYLLLPKNHRMGGDMLSKAVIINDGSLEILEVTEESFGKVAETKKQKGYVAAFQVAESKKADETKIHVAMVQENALPGKTISTIFTYKWHK